jgi:hypothetical protein
MRYLKALENRVNRIVTTQQFNGKSINNELIDRIFKPYLKKGSVKAVFSKIGKPPPPSETHKRYQWLKLFFGYGTKLIADADQVDADQVDADADTIETLIVDESTGDILQC